MYVFNCSQKSGCVKFDGNSSQNYWRLLVAFFEMTAQLIIKSMVTLLASTNKLNEVTRKIEQTSLFGTEMNSLQISRNRELEGGLFQPIIKMLIPKRKSHSPFILRG